MYERVVLTSLYWPFVMEAGDPHSRYLHLGGNSEKNPLVMQVRTWGPERRFPGPHLYSMTDPMSTDLAKIVELAGRSGFPHVRGRCWQTKFKGCLQLVSDQRYALEPSKREQFSPVPAWFQKEMVTSFPLIHFQLLGLRGSLTAPNQYYYRREW